MKNDFLKNEKGFTGLEAAIVLIAFVVVAAVFSYVMLGAGFFTTQKSQEVVHTGVMQASSSIALSGDVIVTSKQEGNASLITLYVTNTAGGTPVDLNKTVITYTDNDDFVTKDYGSEGSNAGANGWKYTPIIFEDGHDDNLLERGEKYKIVITLSEFEATSEPGVNEAIKIEVKPSEGAVLVITRTMPPVLTNEYNYPVF